jgi:hypothetical protein
LSNRNLLTANDIAEQSSQPATLIEDLHAFHRIAHKKLSRERFLRELGWWALVVGALALAVYSIVAR